MPSLFNVSIDDVSPHPLSSVRVLDRCFALLDEFPSMKFSLFVPVAYWRTIPGNPNTVTGGPLIISDHPEFCRALKSLPPENFEICFHGRYHGIPSMSNNDELQRVSRDDADLIIDTMFEIASLSGVPFKPILRPPAWRMSPAAFDSCREKGIRTLALSPDEYARSTYAGKDSEFGRVVYYNANPPFKPLHLFDKTEVVYHACEWDKNYLSEQAADELAEFLRGKDVEFCFIEGLLDG